MASRDWSIFAFPNDQLFPLSVYLRCLLLLLCGCLFLADSLGIGSLVKYVLTNLCVPLPLSVSLCVYVSVSPSCERLHMHEFYPFNGVM